MLCASQPWAAADQSGSCAEARPGVSGAVCSGSPGGKQRGVSETVNAVVARGTAHRFLIEMNLPFISIYKYMKKYFCGLFITVVSVVPGIAQCRAGTGGQPCAHARGSVRGHSWFICSRGNRPTPADRSLSASSSAFWSFRFFPSFCSTPKSSQTKGLDVIAKSF